jgi:uncharacterized protein
LWSLIDAIINYIQEAMMLFTFICQDVDNSLAARKIARVEHLARLKDLAEANRLIIAGPHPSPHSSEEAPEYTGSLIIAEFASLEAAKLWASQDPYITAGVYKEVMVKPFIQALP